MRHVDEFNGKAAAAGRTYRLGEGPFSDLTDGEFSALLLRRRPTPPPVKQAARVSTAAGNASEAVLPSSVDWREAGAVTPVKNQGVCGSCWAFATVAALEGLNKIRNGELVPLSEQVLVDCDTLDRACVEGSAETAFQWIVEQGGITTDIDYPYTGQKDSCESSKVANIHAVSISGHELVESNDEEALMAAVARQPVAVLITIGSDFQHYAGSVFDGPCNNESVYHVMAIVGYGQHPDGYPYWIAKNSWGPNWGEDGFICLRKNVAAQPSGLCGLAARPVYPVM